MGFLLQLIIFILGKILIKNPIYLKFSGVLSVNDFSEASKDDA